MNIVEWNKKKAVVDFRGWNEGHTEMTKGITFSMEEFEELKEKIGGLKNV